MKLKVDKKQPFRICQLTDIHLGLLPLNEESEKTLFEIREFLLYTSCDLIIITGDLLWGSENPDPESTLKRLYDILNEVNIPVAITYGNHDTEGKFSRKQIREFERYLKCLADKQDVYTIFDRENYVLEIYCENQIRNKLYIFDSGDYAKWNVPGEYAVIEPEQVMWYLQKARTRTNENCDLAFMHIPLPEYMQVAKENLIAGQYLEKVCCGEQNSGLFYALERQKNIKGVFVGHDHDNNFESSLNDIKLIYGNVTGYNTYGKLQRGVRMITLYENYFITDIVKF